MNNILLPLLVLLSSAVCFAEEQPKPHHKKKSEMSPQELLEAKAELEKRTGGMILVNQKGVVKYVDFQNSVKPEILSSIAQGLGKAYRIDMRVDKVSGSFEIQKATKLIESTKANACIFIIEDPLLPMTLISPEAKWALVNLAVAKSDAPSAEKLNKRCQKLMMRTSAYLLGAASSNYRGSALDAAFSVADLDKSIGGTVMPDSLMAINNYLPKLGVVPGKVISYRRACIDGIAPPPTNDLQRAVWEREKNKKDDATDPTNRWKRDFEKK